MPSCEEFCLTPFESYAGGLAVFLRSHGSCRGGQVEIRFAECGNNLDRAMRDSSTHPLQNPCRQTGDPVMYGHAGSEQMRGGGVRAENENVTDKIP
jgi:hypothetical protein